MPIISVAILVVTGILSWKIEFFDPNADDSTWLFESIRKDVSSTNWEVKWFLSSIKSSFERSKNEEDTRFNDFWSNEWKSNEPNLRDKFKWWIDFDNDDFWVKPRVDWDNSIRPWIRETFWNDNNEWYIDIPDNNDKKDADFDIRPKDIKWLLRENRDRLSNPQEDIGNDSRKNPFDELSDLNDLSDDSTIRIDESEMPTNDDGYIEITEQEEDDQEIPMDNIDTFESEKPWNLSDSISIVSDVKDNVEKNDFNDNWKKEINFDIYYAVWYNTNSEQVLLDELIKKL